MRRSLLILLALLVVTWFEFEFYPGHTYLQGETQLLVPMLERLDTPGFLSRDLVASHPTFAYTIYDEITQLLHAADGLTFEEALRQQQVFFRFAAVLGVFLWARSLNVPAPVCVALSAAVNAVTPLTAPNAFVTNPEATPVSFALALVFLALGLLMNRHPLFAGLAGGLAVLYDPMTASAFWLVVIGTWITNRELRKLLRPAWFALLIFSLIIGNLAQLQAGLGGDQELTGRFSDGMAQLTQIRTPWVWPSHWAGTELWSYLFLTVAGVWALARMRPQLERVAGWVAIGIMLSGLGSVVFALILLAERMQLATQMQPARNLSFTVAMSVLLCGAAAWQAWQRSRRLEFALWGTIVAAAMLNPQVLDLMRLQTAINTRSTKITPEMTELATWAEQKTWGSSMFQFPDAAEQSYPGIFRALSRRALWADWKSGEVADYSDQAGQTWWSRWQANMQEPYSPLRLDGMLPLPIDYYVLHLDHQLAGVRPVFTNADFAVYDAQDLREAHRPLHH